MFYWGYHFENEIPINCSFTQWRWTYVLDFGPWRWSDLWLSGLQECKGNGFFRVQRAGNNFQLGPWNLDILDERFPLLKLPPQKSFVGGGELNVLLRTLSHSWYRSYERLQLMLPSSFASRMLPKKCKKSQQESKTLYPTHKANKQKTESRKDEAWKGLHEECNYVCVAIV